MLCDAMWCLYLHWPVLSLELSHGFGPFFTRDQHRSCWDFGFELVCQFVAVASNVWRGPCWGARFHRAKVTQLCKKALQDAAGGHEVSRGHEVPEVSLGATQHMDVIWMWYDVMVSVLCQCHVCSPACFGRAHSLCQAQWGLSFCKPIYSSGGQGISINRLLVINGQSLGGVQMHQGFVARTWSRCCCAKIDAETDDLKILEVHLSTSPTSVMSFGVALTQDLQSTEVLSWRQAWKLQWRPCRRGLEIWTTGWPSSTWVARGFDVGWTWVGRGECRGLEDTAFVETQRLASRVNSCHVWVNQILNIHCCWV